MRKIVFIALGIIALALPFIFSNYNLRIMVLALQVSVAVIGLGIAFGWTGLIHLAQATFMGIGAYACALASQHLGLGFWTTTPIAIVASCLVALVIAGPMLRLRGHYLALATVGFSVSVDVVLKNWLPVTGGFDGISGIPGIQLGSFALTTDTHYYYFFLVVVALVSLFAMAIRSSAYGRSMIAVRDDELAAGTSGVNVVRTKILSFVLASAFAGLSGSMFAHYSAYIAPQDFDLVHSTLILVMLIVGGELSVLGAVLGSIVLSFAPEVLRFIGQGYLIFFGAMVIAVLVFMPQGLVGLARSIDASLVKKGVRHAKP